MIKLENAIHIAASVMVIFWIVVAVFFDEQHRQTALLWAILLAVVGMKK